MRIFLAYAIPFSRMQLTILNPSAKVLNVGWGSLASHTFETYLPALDLYKK